MKEPIKRWETWKNKVEVQITELAGDRPSIVGSTIANYAKWAKHSGSRTERLSPFYKCPKPNYGASWFLPWYPRLCRLNFMKIRNVM